MNRIATLALTSALTFALSVVSALPANAQSKEICWENKYHEIVDNKLLPQQCGIMVGLMKKIHAKAENNFKNRSFKATEMSLVPSGDIINAAHGWNNQSISKGVYVDYKRERLMIVDKDKNVIFLYFNSFGETGVNFYGIDGSQTWVDLFLKGETSLNGRSLEGTISPYFGDVKSGSVREFSPAETTAILKKLLRKMQ